jgi:hypothetical protein
MPGAVPGIHVFLQLNASKTWMAGPTSRLGPAMTTQSVTNQDVTEGWQA